MAEDVGTMRIKVVADTSDVEKSVEKTKAKMKEADREAVRMRRSAARWEAAAGAAGVGAAGARAFGGGRAAGGAARAAGAAGVRGFLTRAAMRSMMLRLIPGIGTAIFGVGLARLVMGSNRGRGGPSRAEQEQERQTQLMTELVRNSFVQRRTMQEVVAINRQMADPLRRSLDYQMRMTAAIPVSMQASMVSQQDAAFRLDQANQRAARSRGMRTGPYRDLSRRAMSGMLNFSSSVNESLFAGSSRPIGGAIRGAMIRQIPLIGEALGPLDQAVRFGSELLGREGIRAGEEAEASRRGRRLRMMRLQQRGPGNVLTAPATVTAGGEEEYAFRVQRQRINQQREITKKWQDEVLKLLREMVKAGEADERDLEAAQIRFGRPVEGV